MQSGWQALIMSGMGVLVALALCPIVAAAADTPPRQPLNAASPGWVEPSFPFFSSVLDARKAGADLPDDNLTPRGIILNLGLDCWACFDPDLLRVSAIWRGQGVSPKALAPLSYSRPSAKTPQGQGSLPEPAGVVWLATGIYPGWQIGDRYSLQDPREPAPSVQEVGRGPIAESLGRFGAVRLTESGVVLDYVVAGIQISETWSVAPAATGPIINRHFEVAPSGKSLSLVLGQKASGVSLTLQPPPDAGEAVSLSDDDATSIVRVAARVSPITFAIACALGDAPVATRMSSVPSFHGNAPASRWLEETITSVDRSSSAKAYVVDRIGLPSRNPWQRKIRPCDVQFLPDGTAVVVTLDGDVWLARGFSGTDGTVRWKRFTSGLHEPMSVAIRDGEIFAFDRNGIWRLRDTDGNGEADIHELFSNAFAQTADMREFPSTIRLAPRGEFIIAKGGQQGTTLGKHNGSVLRISADGRKSTLLGYGFRQPNIGVNVQTGLVTSSDQQGNYIPSTPLHVVRDGQFYGFLAAFQPKEAYPAPIAEPLTWVPHATSASAISQVWLIDARMGPLNDALVQIGFNRPEVFRVLLNERGSRLQASMVSLTDEFQFPLLNGSVNPVDGQLYIAGFQVIGWGNVVDTLGGLARVRYTGASVVLPREITPMDRGVLLRFDVALDPVKARDPNSYTLKSWSYRRTFQYGSAQYKEDGTTGQDEWIASSAYLAPDARTVFIAVPGMKPVMQLSLDWSLATAEGEGFQGSGYTTPYELAQFDPRVEGFGDIEVDLTPRAAAAMPTRLVTVEEGKRVAQTFSCIACHATQEGAVIKSGPTWKGLFGSQNAVFVNGKVTQVTVDENYLRESITEPTAKLAVNFEKGEFAMPSFAGVLTDAEIESLILYIKSLR